MMLLEHDAKEFAAHRGIPVPSGAYFGVGEKPGAVRLGTGPWMVKCQATVGGRGKIGAIRKAITLEEVSSIAAEFASISINGHPVYGCRVEQFVSAASEVYLSFIVDGGSRAVRVMLSANGGIDVEQLARSGGMRSTLAAPELSELVNAGLSIASNLPPLVGQAMRDAIPRLATLFLESEAMLLEINPLLVLPDSSWVAGDCKLVIDENVLPRQLELKQIVLARPDAYREAVFKLAHGFDFIKIDPNGQIGLLTTGAGLSMMLIDEMLRAGRKPYNFCDLRSGLLRGSPERLIQVLKQFVEGRCLSVVLVNIFAGITDLGEFARLLLEALDAVPELTVPVVARLIGNNFDAARALLERSSRVITVEMDLDRALGLVFANTEPVS
jgi:succinyl-CoA synthetase beta subunit